MKVIKNNKIDKYVITTDYRDPGNVYMYYVGLKNE